jgi:hypothetical protein
MGDTLQKIAIKRSKDSIKRRQQLLDQHFNRLVAKQKRAFDRVERKKARKLAGESGPPIELDDSFQGAF